MMTLSRRRLLAGSLGAGVLSPQRAAPLRPGRAAPDRRVRERDAQRQPEPGLRGRHAREAAGATRGKAPGIRFGAHARRADPGDPLFVGVEDCEGAEAFEESGGEPTADRSETDEAQPPLLRLLHQSKS